MSEPIDLSSGEWLEANRSNWDERVAIHLASDFYDLDSLRSGEARLDAIEQRELAELFPDGLAGKRILHLQCHFGADTLRLAQRGATVVGIDFSKPAITAARGFASELGLADRARFIQANVYDARHLLPEPESFDIVYTTWGTIGWLPDVREWARIIEWFLKPGGQLYFADGHPFAWVFEGEADGKPVVVYEYGSAEPDVVDSTQDYADESATLSNTRVWEWMHPVSEILDALSDTQLAIDFFREHYQVPWRMFPSLTPTGDGMFAWPGKKWVPLGISIAATKPANSMPTSSVHASSEPADSVPTNSESASSG